MTDKNHIHVLSRAVIIDQSHILLCQTLDLPNNFYFLPGGHIEHNESAEDALLRELVEESGAQGRIKRFLGCLEHSFELGYNTLCHSHEYNFVFEVESDNLKRDHKIPQLEKHIKFEWIKLNELSEIDLRAESFKKLIPAWLELDVQEAFRKQMI